MKTERRHELETNVLAERLAHTAGAAEPYRRVIVVLVVAAAALAFAYTYMSSNQEQKLTEGWNRYDSALRSASNELTEKRMEETIQYHRNEPVAAWAQFWLADYDLGVGIDKLFVDKSDAKDRLKSAIDRFTAVKASGPPMLQQRALLGIGRAQESLGKLDEARKTYDELIAGFKDGPLSKAAQTRRAALENESTKQFYAWFAEYTPPSVDFRKDQGTPGQRPDFDGSLDAPPGGPGISSDDLFRSFKESNRSARSGDGSKSDEAQDDDSQPSEGPAPTGSTGQDQPAESAPPESAPSKSDAPGSN